MKKQHLFISGFFGIGVVVFLVSACMAASSEEIVSYTGTGFAMDTVVSSTLYTTGEDLTEDLIELLGEAEREWLSWTEEESEISIINKSSGNKVKVSEKLAVHLEELLQVSAASDGAMDPTLGKVIRLWDIDGKNPHIPEETVLEELLAETGYEKISLEENYISLDKGCTLDLGGAGKGIGCEEAAEYLEKHPEVSGAILNLGGSSVLAYGQKPDGSAWRIAVTDPRDEQKEYLGVVSLETNEYLSTSGDYEKYFIEDGIRYHHILDPDTGYPVQNGLTSVTVVCRSGLLADALSTACFVLGREKSSALLETYEAAALFVDEEHCIYAENGMEERFELLKDTYIVQES